MSNVAGSYNGITRSQQQYIERETDFEVCAACQQKIWPGTYRERKDGRINCFNCLQLAKKAAAPKLPDPPAKVPDLAARKKGRTAPQR